MASSIYIYENMTEYTNIYKGKRDFNFHETSLIDLYVKNDKLWVVTNTNKLKEQPQLQKSIVHFRNGSVEQWLEGDEICVNYGKIRYNMKDNNIEINPKFMRKALLSLRVDRFYGNSKFKVRNIDYHNRFYDLTRDRINLVLEN